jgi:ankyrin repeat protein
MDGVTPLLTAVLLGDVAIMELLLTYGADPLMPSTLKIGDEEER